MPSETYSKLAAEQSAQMSCGVENSIVQLAIPNSDTAGTESLCGRPASRRCRGGGTTLPKFGRVVNMNRGLGGATPHDTDMTVERA